ncbi:MAG: DUF86 domain-containing protein [bacterium]|nr:DUF86 domain-containing protein [bacterium]
MSKREVDLLLEDISEAIEKIFNYIKDLNFSEFAEDSKTIDAVVRNFEIIGEATKQLPEDWKDDHASVEWYKLAGMRNRIVHKYFGIDLEMIWTVINKN